ncbi:MAG TPA: polyamine aminopropyltransferase [Burkholderiales bacterium]|nr:polyamine aminopropyltransferase [Burkholderiales bacterium]
MAFLKRWRVRRQEEDSTSVYISEKSGVRTLHIGSDTVQSSMRLARPNELELAYTRSMMAFLLFHPDPRQVLMIGLGGGSLARFIHHRLPAARIVAVEINPQVVSVAQEFFRLPAEDARFGVVIDDGAAYLQSAGLQADVILVDGYDAEAQVRELATGTFYRDCARALGENGILVVNLWGGDREFGACVDRIARAFDGRVACLPAGRPGNVVALAFKASPGQPRWGDLVKRAQALEARYDLEFPRFVRDLAVMNPHDEERLLL